MLPLLWIVSAGLGLLVACGGGNPAPPASNNPNNDQNNADAGNNGPNNGDAGNNGPVDDPYTECESDGECDGDLVCMAGVCVQTPQGMPDIVIGWEVDDRVVPATHDPNVACYSDPPILGDDVQYIEMRGEIEKFGPGGNTQNLCVTIYNGDRFLDYWPDACADIAENDTDELEECFERDPCRCLDADDPDECMLAVGYCAGIGDSGMQEECRTTFAYDGSNANRDAGMESTLIYGFQESGPRPGGNPADAPGWFEIPDIPTHTRLVVKVSGRKSRWIDTYQYGVYLLNDNIDDDGTMFVRSDGNVISIGAWNTIPSTALVPAGIQDGNGAVAGRVLDCGEDGRMIDYDGEMRDISEPLPIEFATVGLTIDAKRISYFNGNPDDTLPLPSQPYTNKLATFAAIDAPNGRSRASAVGYIDGELSLIGQLDYFLAPRSVAIVTFEGSYTPAP